MNGRERPTTPSKGDLSSCVPSASAAPADRSEPCVCGGVIVVLADEDIPFVVEQHNRSALHLFWRWRTGRVSLSRWLGIP